MKRTYRSDMPIGDPYGELDDPRFQILTRGCLVVAAFVILLIIGISYYLMA